MDCPRGYDSRLVSEDGLDDRGETLLLEPLPEYRDHAARTFKLNEILRIITLKFIIIIIHTAVLSLI